MINGLKNLFHFHRYHLHHVRGANRYLQCRCGHRTWEALFNSIYSPLDQGWLDGLEPSEGGTEMITKAVPPNDCNKYVKEGEWVKP